MTSFALDPARSSVTLRTYAGGLFSALAHDLELTAKVVRGETKNDGERWEGELAIEPSAIKVVGVLKRGTVDKNTLSAGDVRDIEGRIASEIFGGLREIVIRGEGAVSSPTVKVVGKKDGLADVKVTVRNDGASRIFTAKGKISIKSLGIPEVKGPLGAFVIKDHVDIDASVIFVAT